MPQYFVSESVSIGDIVHITGDDFFHLSRVRRARSGQHIRIASSDRFFEAEIICINERDVSARIVSEKKTADASCTLTLSVALLKSTKFDFVIQKAAELGVASVVPVVTERAVPDIAGKEKSKLDRWQRIALEASKQSLRTGIMKVENVCSFDEALSFPAGLKVIAHPDISLPSISECLAEYTGDNSAVLLVGPEGGFSPRELQAAQDASWHALNFGSTQLRAETAALVLPAIMLYEWEKFFV